LWEDFIDSENGFWDPWEDYEDSGNQIRESWEDFIDEPSLRYNRKLSWTPTNESLEDFTQYIIYRVVQKDGDRLKDLDNCNCQIDNLPSNMNDRMTNGYIESDSIFVQTVAIQDKPDTFYYRIRVVAGAYTRDSYIHYNGFDELEGITLAEDAVTKNKSEYIEISWEPIQASHYFYQYEIWRKLGVPGAGNDSSLVVIIPNSEIDHFMDRGDEFIDGTTYSYSVAVVDINKRRQYSNFIEGYSNPYSNP
jgi:hypothetical protein